MNGWLRGSSTLEAPLEAIEGFNDYFLAFQEFTQPNFIVRLKQEQALLRLLVFRVNTIKETSFVGAGYSIAWIASLLLVIAMVLADFAAIGAELFLVCAITFVVAYLVPHPRLGRPLRLRRERQARFRRGVTRPARAPRAADGRGVATT